MPRHSVAFLLLALAACSPKAYIAIDRHPTLLVTNGTGTPLQVVAYDYTTPVGGPPGVYVSPEFPLGRVNSTSACVTLTGLPIADEFALVAEDTLGAMDSPGSTTFVPQDSPGWVVTFDSFSRQPIGPVRLSNACSP